MCYISDMKLSVDSEIFTRCVADIIPKDTLESVLAQNKNLRIKHGIDATSPFLHLGHAANLWKLRSLQEAGHKAVILLGDFTTKIGDPTGRTKSRPVLSDKEISANIKSIKGQIEHILLTDPEVYEVRQNSEWFSKMKTAEFLGLVSTVTHARLIERDMFQERIKKGLEINMAEILYPILQGYDSVMLGSDMTIIGSDQIFNEHLGRFFQERFGHTPQIIMGLEIIPGLDGGEKMSKSANNFIGLLDSPTDKFGKAMRLPDNLIIPYLKAYTDVSMTKIKEIEKTLQNGGNPMEAKFFWAERLAARYHGDKIAIQEKENFINIFSEKKTPLDIPVLKVEKSVWAPVELLVETGLAGSKSEARRLLKQKSVDINGETLNGEEKQITLGQDALIQVGKRKFVRIKVE